jgi:ABC-type phosphate transport system ATPase subunit
MIAYSARCSPSLTTWKGGYAQSRENNTGSGTAFKNFFSRKGIRMLSKISISVRRNEFLVLLGPGQCGKTTF